MTAFESVQEPALQIPVSEQESHAGPQVLGASVLHWSVFWLSPWTHLHPRNCPMNSMFSGHSEMLHI
jgi:hypothetical protein